MNDYTTSPNARKLRMVQLVNVDMKGKLDDSTGKIIEADHVDALRASMKITVALFADILMKILKVVQNGIAHLITRWAQFKAK